MKKLLAASIVLVSGCGTNIPLFDKPGATRDQEFADKLVCVKNRQDGFLPSISVQRCMKDKG